MNTELRLYHKITCSNKHGKSAKDNRFTDLVKNWIWQKTASGSNVQSTKSTCYRNLTWENKAWQYYTKRIWQKSLTDHKPKRTRRYDGKHVNIASFVNRFQTAENRAWQKQQYEGILVSLMHSLQRNTWQNKHTYSKMACLWSYPWQEKIHSMHETTTTSLAKLNNT